MIEEHLAIWALSEIDGVGPAILNKIIESFGSASAVFDSPKNVLIESESMNRHIVEKIKAPIDWDGIKSRCEKSIPDGAKMVVLTDPKYPGKLKNINDPSPYLYYVGDINIFEGPSLAIVGSRRPSDYGLRIASRLAGELASAGVLIVSGLAYGIDGAAHQSALEAGGKTAAVFGCGLDKVYPEGHAALARRISQTGCLLSEFPKGTKPERFNFPIRNRIVSGLSDGVLVIEASERSGALVTAKIALDQNRDVFALPGSVDNKLSYGPNELIKQGAIAVTSAKDIFDNFGWHLSKEPKSKAVDLGKLTKDELNLFGHLSVQPVHLDELNRKAGMGHGKIAEVLLNLELKGFIIRKPGNYVVKA